MKTYTKEFKESAIQYAKDHPNLTNRDAAKNLGVPYDTYYGWIQSKRRADNPESFDESGNLSEVEKENQRLQRELRDAKDALEILKKAISILGN